MSDIFAMQRANGDWFALDHHGRLRVPLFHSSQDVMIARLRNFGLLVFKPVLLNARFLKEIVPLPGEDEVDFCMVDDPFASLNRGSPMRRTQLALLISRPDEHEKIVTNRNTFQPIRWARLLKVIAKQLRPGRMKEAHARSVREGDPNRRS
jgi:hypothetical protein